MSGHLAPEKFSIFEDGKIFGPDAQAAQQQEQQLLMK